MVMLEEETSTEILITMGFSELWELERRFDFARKGAR